MASLPTERPASLSAPAGDAKCGRMLGCLPFLVLNRQSNRESDRRGASDWVASAPVAASTEAQFLLASSLASRARDLADAFAIRTFLLIHLAQTLAHGTVHSLPSVTRLAAHDGLFLLVPCCFVRTACLGLTCTALAQVWWSKAHQDLLTQEHTPLWSCIFQVHLSSAQVPPRRNTSFGHQTGSLDARSR